MWRQFSKILIKEVKEEIDVWWNNCLKKKLILSSRELLTITIVTSGQQDDLHVTIEQQLDDLCTTV